MTQLARIAQIRNVLLCTLATLTLVACGGGADSSGTAATSSESDAAPVQSNVGMIDRSQGSDETQGTSSGATVASTTEPNNTTAPNTAATTPATGSGSTTAPATNKATTPVKVVTTNGAATLDWMPPTSNSDGSALINLAGYTVYYGTSANNLSQSIKVSNPGLASYVVTGLNSGTWYFAVTSYSSDGVESARTNTVSTTI
ncbi:MAG: fibronectin type III domain-containing protein [Proteobacteria bacterium]|nr:fibronectin type III domain-containing protein [Pseudomonadota bacterium]